MLTVLHSFCSQAKCADGFSSTRLVQASAQLFYGATTNGGYYDDQGVDGYGTVFSVTPSGKFTTLCTFKSECPGIFPSATLAEGPNHVFLGNAYTSLFSVDKAQKVTTIATLTLDQGEDLITPFVYASDRLFYGAASGGGTNSCFCGTIFSLGINGSPVIVLYNFGSATGGLDGRLPNGLIQGTDGNFYGTTYSGGANNYGTLFKFNNGLKAFILTRPSGGKTGATVIILATA